MRNPRATLLIRMWEKFCTLIDFLTLDLMTGKSWVKKDRTAPLRSADASRPEESERPHPWPPERPLEQFQREAFVMRRASPAEREEFVARFRKIVERERARRDAALQAEIDSLVGPVAEGDPR